MSQESNNNQRPSRRTFIHGTAAASASAAIATSRFVHAAEGSSDNSQEIRIGIIGCGGRGTGALNDSLTINENVKIVAAADLYQKKLDAMNRNISKKYPDKIDLPASAMHAGLDGYKKVLEDPNVDLVIMTTSPGFRPHHVLEGVQAGKHLFAEKPSCVDPHGYRVCLKAHDLAVKNGTAIVTGTQYRRQVNYVGAIEAIKKGMIGDIVGAVSRYCSTGIWNRIRKEGMSDTEYQLNNWMHHIWLSGDQITEQAVHNIDTMNWVMGGPPESAYGSGGRFTRPDGSEMWDSVSVDYVYPGDRNLSFACRQIPGTQGDNGNTIYGTEATLYIGAGNGGSKITDRSGNEIWNMPGKISDAYKQEHKDLVDSIREGKPIVELKQTADSSLTAVMGRLTAYTGRKVTWDFLTNESKLNLFPEELKWDGDRPESAYAVPGKTKLT